MTTTRDLAARFVPLPRAGRARFLARVPKRKGRVSQLKDSFDGTWYLHRGDLTVDGDLESVLNLVVDGDLTVRGTLTDDLEEARLVVTGDLRAENVLSRHLLVVLGSLLVKGVVYADYNDWAFEVWGRALRARAFLVSDRSVVAPKERVSELAWDFDQAEANGDPASILAPGLLRTEDERVVPADFDAFLEEHRAGCPLFVSPASSGFDDPGAWRLDRCADGEVVASMGASDDAKERVAAASHPSAAPALLARLASDADPHVRAAVAVHAALPAGAATSLSADPEADVRRLLSAGPHGAAHLLALVKDSSPEVRRATASHPSLDDGMRRLLLADPEKGVKGRALRYLPVTSAWVAELGESKDELLCAWAVEHAAEAGSGGDAPAGAGWEAGLLDPRRAVREAALKSARDPRVLAFAERHRERFSTDPSPAIRRLLAAAARDEATLELLARDEDEDVRRTALQNLAVPARLLLAEAGRLASAGRGAWNTFDPRYTAQMSAFQDLHRHPRLPSEALRALHRSFPLSYRLEPHRNMPLDVALERAESLTPSLAFDAAFGAWKEAAAGEPGRVLAEMLASDDGYLQSAARMSLLVPAEALLAHASSVLSDAYAVAEIAASPLLGGDSPAVEELLKVLLGAGEGGVDRALAGNPDLPVRFLRELLRRAPEEAWRTLWQAHGETP